MGIGKRAKKIYRKVERGYDKYQEHKTKRVEIASERAGRQAKALTKQIKLKKTQAQLAKIGKKARGTSKVGRFIDAFGGINPMESKTDMMFGSSPAPSAPKTRTQKVYVYGKPPKKKKTRKKARRRSQPQQTHEPSFW